MDHFTFKIQSTVNHIDQTGESVPVFEVHLVKAGEKGTCVIVKELDVSVFLGSDGDGYSRVTQHSVDSAGGVCSTKR